MYRVFNALCSQKQNLNKEVAKTFFGHLENMETEYKRFSSCLSLGITKLLNLMKFRKR